MQTDTLETVSSTQARRWSDQQVAIFAWFATGRGNLIVRARAGTGKTTTLLEGVSQAPEQSILIAAFNKRIQTELAGKVTNPNATALTLHAVGNQAVRRYWERLGIDSAGKRAIALAEHVCGSQAPDPLKRLVSKLVTKAREMAPFAETPDELAPIAITFDCVPDDVWKQDGFDLAWVCARTLDAMVHAAAVKPVATGIDFADMLYLPLRNRWLRPVYDLVVIDEAQDMTLTQLSLARGVCREDGRMCVVGDDRQAVYGFRGADSTALDRLKTELKAEELGLNTTYRCGRAIVAVAARLVPDYLAAPTAHEGIVREIPASSLLDQIAPGDFMLSRKNAPLVSVALALIRKGVRAKIEGRDIGAGLAAIVRKLATGPAKTSIPKWLEKLGTWREREVTRAEKAQLEAKVEQVRDQAETLLALADGVAGIPELLTRLEMLFADTEGQGGAMVVCSSVHRAKGLEAERVFILRDTLNPPVACGACRHRHQRGGCKCGCVSYFPDPLAQREEQNIEYVAITRAKSELVWAIGEFVRSR